MKNILHITSSPRGEASHSTMLGRTVIEKLLLQYPGSTVVTNDVTGRDYDYLRETHVIAYRSPEDQLTTEQRQALLDSDEAVAQMFNADIIIVSVPLYNFGIPASLKAWIDHIVRAGKTFSYHTGKPEGMLKGKKVVPRHCIGRILHRRPDETDGPCRALPALHTRLYRPHGRNHLQNRRHCHTRHNGNRRRERIGQRSHLIHST